MSEPLALFCSLGRCGDVLNALPLAWHYYQTTGRKPYFQTAAAYADLLDGVSYVEPVIYPGEFTSGILAFYQARQLTTDIRVCQIYGFGINPPMDCTSFARQSWVSAGADVPWGSLPLVLDRREVDREAKLRWQHIRSIKPSKLVLVAMEGQSSPFPYRGLVMQELGKRLGDGFEIIDLSKIKAQRFYDLLGLFDVAHCLVTIDTGHLHLAHASKVPVVSFITRDPSGWHGSPWRPNHVGRWYYDEVPRFIDEIRTCVLWAGQIIPPKIIHTWSDWREIKDGHPCRSRIQQAQYSWAHEYANGYWLPAEHKQQAGCRSGLDVGDPHPLSFVHDTIENGIAKATKESDIICLTNSDIGFTPGLTGQILEVVGRTGAAFAHRRDFAKVEKPFVSESQVKRGRWYPGSDLFAFTVGWWKQHKHEYGDFLMGRAHWDEVFRQFVKYHGGGNLPNCIWHQTHEAFWSTDENLSLPGNLHNDKLRQQWFQETGFQEEDFRYFRCAEEHRVPPQT